MTKRIVCVLVVIAGTACVETDDVGVAEQEIVGGYVVSWDDYPWAAQIYDEQFGWDGRICGGSLIAPRWVVSAAHCSDSADYVKVHGRRIAIADKIVHPQADFPANDVALFLLAEAVDDVVPVALNLDDGYPSAVDLSEATAERANSAAMGWGDTSEGGDGSDDLRRVELPIVSNASCLGANPGIDAGHICAGYADGGKDSCQGDSGGPLTSAGIAGELLVGTTSGGVGCARPAMPGYYVRVSRYAAWIAQHVPQIDARSPAAIMTAIL